ncbi:MAG TPA: Rrf2 family transcriptional regulator [Pirellulales bacterium]
MRVSAKTEYACIAMLELAVSYDADEPVRIRKIADEHDIPQRFLVQILLQLKGAGLVVSTRGASGGYQLSRTPDEITLGEIVSVIEGPPESPPASASRKSAPSQVLAAVWQDISRVEQDTMREITLAELVKRLKVPNNDMYYI